jgi:hypothetical protein
VYKLFDKIMSQNQTLENKVNTNRIRHESYKKSYKIRRKIFSSNPRKRRVLPPPELTYPLHGSSAGERARQYKENTRDRQRKYMRQYNRNYRATHPEFVEAQRKYARERYRKLYGVNPIFTEKMRLASKKFYRLHRKVAK